MSVSNNHKISDILTSYFRFDELGLTLSSSSDSEKENGMGQSIKMVKRKLEGEKRQQLLLLHHLFSAAPIYQGSPQLMFSNIRTEHLPVFYARCPS